MLRAWVVIQPTHRFKLNDFLLNFLHDIPHASRPAQPAKDIGTASGWSRWGPDARALILSLVRARARSRRECRHARSPSAGSRGRCWVAGSLALDKTRRPELIFTDIVQFSLISTHLSRPNRCAKPLRMRLNTQYGFTHNTHTIRLYAQSHNKVSNMRITFFELSVRLPGYETRALGNTSQWSPP